MSQVGTEYPGFTFLFGYVTTSGIGGAGSQS
jgi:hypothetical protein